MTRLLPGGRAAPSTWTGNPAPTASAAVAPCVPNTTNSTLNRSLGRRLASSSIWRSAPPIVIPLKYATRMGRGDGAPLPIWARHRTGDARRRRMPPTMATTSLGSGGPPSSEQRVEAGAENRQDDQQHKPRRRVDSRTQPPCHERHRKRRQGAWKVPGERRRRVPVHGSRAPAGRAAPPSRTGRCRRSPRTRGRRRPRRSCGRRTR